MQNMENEDVLHFDFTVYGPSKVQDASLSQFREVSKSFSKVDQNL